jgi:hypothetical protein
LFTGFNIELGSRLGRSKGQTVEAVFGLGDGELVGAGDLMNLLALDS